MKQGDLRPANWHEKAVWMFPDERIETSEDIYHLMMGVVDRRDMGGEWRERQRRFFENNRSRFMSGDSPAFDRASPERIALMKRLARSVECPNCGELILGKEKS